MHELIQTLQNLPLMLTAKPASTEQIIRAQQDLKINNIAAIPQDFTELLHQINTIEYDGCYLFGINPRSYYLDIFAENEMIDLPALKEEAKKQEATITQYLTAVLIYAIYLTISPNLLNYH